MKKVSVIIPTFNKPQRLKLVLKSLEHQITDEVEVVVVFDGCERKIIDDFQKMSFSFTPVQVICKDNIGRAAARNKGIEKSKGNIIIFLDDDRVVSADFISEHLKVHREVGNPAAVLGMRKELYLDDAEIEAYGHSIESLKLYCEENGDTQKYLVNSHNKRSTLRWLNFYTGNASVNREALMKAGCFDENFRSWGHEDIDLGIRLYLQNVCFFYTDKAVNYHMMHSSNFSFNRESLNENLKYMIMKYKGHLFIQILLTLMREKEKRKGIPISTEQKRIYKEKSGSVNKQRHHFQ